MYGDLKNFVAEDSCNTMRLSHLTMPLLIHDAATTRQNIQYNIPKRQILLFCFAGNVSFEGFKTRRLGVWYVGLRAAM